MSDSTTDTPDLSVIQNKLVEFLTASGWRDKLKTFMVSEDFYIILERLLQLKNAGIRFTPPLKDMFNCFVQCPYNEVKVVIVGDQPFRGFDNTGEPIADGLAFSQRVSSNKHVQTENSLIRFAANNVIGDPNLTRWANQGVLLLNSALTVPVNAIRAPYDLYQPFITFILDVLNSLNQGLIFLFVGKEAQEYESLINDNRHFKYAMELSTSYGNVETFNQIKDVLKTNYDITINW
jgi:uracil-DNA glycosylase